MQQKKLVIVLIISFFIILNVYHSAISSSESIIVRLFGFSFAPWFYMFLCGAFFAKFKQHLEQVLKSNFFILITLFLISYYFSNHYLDLGWGNSINPVSYLLMIFIVINCAFLMPTLSNKILKKNDVSYGIYIFHMPIINYVIYNYGVGEIQYIAVVIATVLFGTLSWFLIERPALRMKINQARKN